jgi:hypothetical protein
MSHKKRFGLFPFRTLTSRYERIFFRILQQETVSNFCPCNEGQVCKEAIHHKLDDGNCHFTYCFNAQGEMRILTKTSDNNVTNLAAF